jgi:hypothetical protein
VFLGEEHGLWRVTPGGAVPPIVDGHRGQWMGEGR